LSKATVRKLFLPTENKTVDAEHFLNELSTKAKIELRRNLKLEESDEELLCSTCFQVVELSKWGQDKYYFKHLYNSDDCPIKKTCLLTEEEKRLIEYNGQKESLLHKETKLLIASLLKATIEFNNVLVEKTFREENSRGIAKAIRRPDVSAINTGLNTRIAFEIQLSPLFVDIIIGREHFYRDNNAAIIWIFREFDKTTFTKLDIFYANNANAFVLDDEAIQESKKNNKLYLKCFYDDYFIEGKDSRRKISSITLSELVAVHELKLNLEEGKLYYFDSRAKEEALGKEIEATNVGDNHNVALQQSDDVETTQKELFALKEIVDNYDFSNVGISYSSINDIKECRVPLISKLATMRGLYRDNGLGKFPHDKAITETINIVEKFNELLNKASESTSVVEYLKGITYQIADQRRAIELAGRSYKVAILTQFNQNKANLKEHCLNHFLTRAFNQLNEVAEIAKAELMEEYLDSFSSLGKIFNYETIYSFELEEAHRYLKVDGVNGLGETYHNTLKEAALKSVRYFMSSVKNEASRLEALGETAKFNELQKIIGASRKLKKLDFILPNDPYMEIFNNLENTYVNFKKNAEKGLAGLLSSAQKEK